MSTPTNEEVEAARKVLALAEPASSAPARYKVVESLQRGGADRVFFTSVSKARAKAFIERNCPRGSHFHLLNPDGTMESYEHERNTGGPQGEELDAWQPFDRDAYQAPELTPTSAADPWADAWEGAQ